MREALGHEIGNNTLEGYPGNRFHAGAEYVDVVERLAIERARKLFGVAYANGSRTLARRRTRRCSSCSCNPETGS